VHRRPLAAPWKTRQFVLVACLSALVLAGAAFGYLQIRKRTSAEQDKTTSSALGSTASPSEQPPTATGAATPTNESAQTESSSPEPQPSSSPDTGQSTVAPPQNQSAQPPGGGLSSGSSSAIPRSPQRSARGTGGGAPPPAPAAPAYQQAHESAEQAFTAARYIEPPDDSALFWARRARQQGDPAADQIEQQVFDRMTATVQAARGTRNYDLAAALLAKLLPLFPDRAELQQMNAAIRQEQQQQEESAKQVERQRQEAELRAQTKQFALRHRHVIGLQSLKPVYSFCEGILRITPDGIARFDCTRTEDPRGRCDHVVFSAGDIRGVRANNDGSLRLAARSGNFDFYGDSSAIQGSLEALRTLVRK